MVLLVLALLTPPMAVPVAKDIDLGVLRKLLDVAVSEPRNMDAQWQAGRASVEAEAWADCRPTPSSCTIPERERRGRILETFVEGRACWEYSVPAGRRYYDYCHFKNIAAQPGKSQRQIESHYFLIKEGGPRFDCEGSMVGRCLFQAIEETYRGHICPLQGTRFFAEVCADLAKWTESAAKSAVMPGDGDADRLESSKLLERVVRQGQCLKGDDAKSFQAAIAPAAAILKSGRARQ